MDCLHLSMSKKSQDSDQLIDLNDFKKTFRDSYLFQNKLLKVLGKRVFEFQSLELVYFEALRVIEQTKDVEFNEDSINENILIVLEHFGFDNIPEVTIEDLTTGEITVGEVESPLYNFSHYIIGIVELPYLELKKIRGKVESDLEDFNKLIEHYESWPDIKTLFAEGKLNTTEGILKTHFYNRSLIERQAILNYYLKGMYDYALQKAMQQKGKWFSALNNLFNLNHRPYDYGRTLFGRNYDYRKIDCSTHRLIMSNITMDQYIEFRKLYNSDKAKFYDEYFKIRSVEQTLNSIDNNLIHLPVSKARIAIFKEMKRFFLAEEWLAFYAIALPQVEGLFSEMIESEKTKTTGRNALSAKVREVRSWFRDNEKNLDYYEYALPTYRNRFAHGGLLDDMKLLAFDLLTDLNDVVKLFSEAKKPSVKVSRTIRRKNEIDFAELSMFGEFFQAVESLTPQMKLSLEEEIKNFTSEFLLPNKESLASKIKERLESYTVAKRQMNECLSEKNLPQLGETKDLTKLFTSDKQREDLYKENITLFVDTSDLKLFFRHFRTYKKKYIAEKDFLSKEQDNWKKENAIVQNVEQIEVKKEED